MSQTKASAASGLGALRSELKVLQQCTLARRTKLKVCSSAHFDLENFAIARRTREFE